MENGHLRGIAARTDIVASLRENRPLHWELALTCRPAETIRKSQGRLIESKTGMIALTNEADSTVLAVVTLHDLLRAQLAAGKREQQ